MSTTSPADRRTLQRLQNRLDAMALEQLREVAAQLFDELEHTKTQLDYAEQAADFWREQVMHIHDELARDEIDHRVLYMTVTGEMHVIDTEKS